MSNYIRSNSGADKIAHQIALEVPVLIDWAATPAIYMESLVRLDNLCSETTRAYKAVFTLWDNRNYGLVIVFRLNNKDGAWKTANILATDIKSGKPWHYTWVSAEINWANSTPRIQLEKTVEYHAAIVTDPHKWVYYDITSQDGKWVLVKVTKTSGVPAEWKHAVKFENPVPCVMYVAGMNPQVMGFARPENIPSEQLQIAVELELGGDVIIVEDPTI